MLYYNRFFPFLQCGSELVAYLVFETSIGDGYHSHMDGAFSLFAIHEKLKNRFYYTENKLLHILRIWSFVALMKTINEVRAAKRRHRRYALYCRRFPSKLPICGTCLTFDWKTKAQSLNLIIKKRGGWICVIESPQFRQIEMGLNVNYVIIVYHTLGMYNRSHFTKMH